MSAGDTAIVVLAGGRATRFPGKLEHPIGGEPMLLRVCRNARAAGLPVYLQGAAFSPAIAARAGLPVLPDERPGEGPLRALLSACGALPHRRIFALAGDEPCVEASLLAYLCDAWEPGDEAAIPRHDGRIEPLAALYSRTALARAARACLGRGDRAMRAAVGGLNARLVTVDASYFANVNAPGDLVEAERTRP